ncbi:hypothetical protein [Rhizobium leguminosarum]|uniref:hypothetical protein n=1 Tax=Rhizobium leguminosarum TaxID=384 RepID=UPI0013AF8979|nr:hypothetical protein [Rhizobium leguminosarum]
MTGRHDNELIKIGYFLHDERLIGPSILGIGAEQDDRQDPAALLEPDRVLVACKAASGWFHEKSTGESFAPPTLSFAIRPQETVMKVRG